uniref:U43-Theraphotoxin-Ct1a_1 n=1 Tax=Coremiocnemis tropix TaxID=1904443 RepID=A0A482Z7P7_CORTR
MGFLALIFLTLLVSTFSQECGTRTCREGQCCRVTFFIFNRCSALAGLGRPCARRSNTSNRYYWSCPCQAGLECRGLFPLCRRPRIATSTAEMNSTTPLTTSSSGGTSVVTEESTTERSISTSSSTVVITSATPTTTTETPPTR